MKILITGATGFVGRNLLAELAKDPSNEITCIIRNTSILTPLVPFDDQIKCITTMEHLTRREVSEQDIIYHIAGQLGKKGIPYSAYTEPAKEITRSLLSSMRPTQRFVFMSSQYVTLPNITNYESARHEGELITQVHADSRSIPYRIIRPSFIYGEHDYHHLPLFKAIKRLSLLFPIPGNGKNLVCPTCIDDVVTLTINAFEYPDHILPVAGKPISMNYFLKIIANNMNRPRPIFHVPAFKSEPLSSILHTLFFAADHSKFTSAIKPTATEYGIHKYAGWYNNQ